ncbi:MAG: peptidylprolyl isomerase [Candidatus Norongarragalinales archaeon]
MKEGDFAEVDFTGKTDGRVFETTLAEDAKKAGLYDEKRVFKPVLIVAGKRMLVSGLDDEIVKAGENGSGAITLAPEKAFGQRNPNLVRLISLSKFQEQGITPAPGMTLEIDNMPARVVSAEGGRVKVDLNHPLAGKTIDYSFAVKKVYADASSKVQAVASNLFSQTGVSAKLDGPTARFFVPAGVRKDAAFLEQKFKSIEMLLAFAPEVKKVVFEEEYSAQQ